MSPLPRLSVRPRSVVPLCGARTPPASVPPLRAALRGALALGLLALAAATAAAASPRVLLLDAALAGADVVCVGERGIILRSSDAGGSWENAHSATTATLTGITFAPDGRLGWAVGHDALILATADGGRSWRQQWQGSSLEASFLDVCALDARHVIAVGAYGLCLVTADGGATWSERKVIDADMHLNRITRGPTGTLYLAGERGTLLRSADQGETWTRIDSPYDGSFYGILPLGPRRLVAYGLRGRIFHSSDDGDTWSPAAINQPVLLATGVKLKSGAVVLAGQGGSLFGSRDDGSTFAAWAKPSNDAIAELLSLTDGSLLSVGEAGASVISPAALAAPAP